MMMVRLRMMQANWCDGGTEANLDKLLAAITAAEGKADLLVFPETCLQGFPTPANIARLAEPVSGSSVSAIRLAAKRAGVSVVFGFAEEDGGRFFNTALLVDADGEVRLTYRKSHLYESDGGVFEPGRDYPVCDWQGCRLSLLICFDIEFPESARALAHNGAELIVVLDGMMEPYNHVHRTMLPVRAMENQLFVALCNRVGEGEQYRFCGQSQIADPFGTNLVIASDTDEAVIDMELDLSGVAKAREEYSYLAQALDADWSKQQI